MDTDFWLPSTRGLIQKETLWFGADFILTFFENESNRLSPAHAENQTHRSIDQLSDSVILVKQHGLDLERC